MVLGAEVSGGVIREGFIGTAGGLATQNSSSLARPRSFASPRPLARTNETKRFPSWGRKVLTSPSSDLLQNSVPLQSLYPLY